MNSFPAFVLRTLQTGFRQPGFSAFERQGASLFCYPVDSKAEAYPRDQDDGHVPRVFAQAYFPPFSL